MSTILEELSTYRNVLFEMDKPRRLKCSGCGRDKMKKYLKPVKGKDGLYYEICQIPYGRKKEVKESSNRLSLPELLSIEVKNSHKSGNATRLFYYLQAQKRNLSALADYDTFINSWAGTEWLKQYAGQIQRLAQEENKFLARQGRYKKWFTDRIPEEKEINEGTAMRWKVSDVPTGPYRSFDKRGWPSAYYSTGEPAVALYCDAPYSGRTSKETNLEIRIGLADHSKPSNTQTGAGFTWRYLKQRASSLEQAKVLAFQFLKNHPEFAPKPEEQKEIETIS